MGGTHSNVSSEHRKPLLHEEKAVEEENSEHFEAVIFQVNSFIAVLWPVLLTMIIASFVATNVQDPQTKANMESYLYYKDIDGSDESSTTKTVEALTNALVIVAFIACVTFAVVFLYKFNCMKGLVGYLMFSSSVLLGVVGSVLVKAIFVDKLGWSMDVYSVTFVMYNFAIVGTISIFYQKGVPGLVEKGYLIATSVIMAWQLCQWPEWSAWTILCMLAFWDLFAVLTPCGPLRCLVNMISKEGRPMPGLLYEADVHSTHLAPRDAYDMDRYSQDRPESGAIELSPLLSRENTETRTKQPEVDDHRQDIRIKRFEHQILAFYEDFNPDNAPQAQKLSSVYFANQYQLWRALFEKYQVKHTPRNRPYPPAALILQLEQESRGKCGIVLSYRIDMLIGVVDPSTIKLGLGDFIFYSVLVGRAGLHGFGTFSACLLCVVMGLGATMYLLTKFHALPALPISILLATAMFACSEGVIMPMLNTFGSNLVLC